MALLDEMLDPMDQGIAVALIARIRHLADDKELHLALVIERGADLQQSCDLGSDAFCEIRKSQVRVRTGHVASLLVLRASSLLLPGTWRRVCAHGERRAGHYD